MSYQITRNVKSYKSEAFLSLFVELKKKFDSIKSNNSKIKISRKKVYSLLNIETDESTALTTLYLLLQKYGIAKVETEGKDSYNIKLFDLVETTRNSFVFDVGSIFGMNESIHSFKRRYQQC